MKAKYYFIKDEGDATAAPVFIVLAGQSERDQRAVAALSVAALLSDSIYFCRQDPTSLAFVDRLFWQNPNREYYRLTAPKMLAVYESRANVEDVENLSQTIRARKMYTAVATHDNRHIHLVSPTILQNYATLINFRKPRRRC